MGKEAGERAKAIGVRDSISHAANKKPNIKTGGRHRHRQFAILCLYHLGVIWGTKGWESMEHHLSPAYHTTGSL